MATKHEIIDQLAALGVEAPASATKAELEALLKSRLATGGILPPTASLTLGDGRPETVVPLEVSADRVMPRARGPFRGGIIVNESGRCAVCQGPADHVHHVGSSATGGELATLDARAVDVPADGSDAEVTGDGTGEALAPIDGEG